MDNYSVKENSTAADRARFVDTYLMRGDTSARNVIAAALGKFQRAMKRERDMAETLRTLARLS